MIKKSLISVIVASSLAACGGGDNDEIKNNTRGNIVITGTDLFAGATLSAEATDADGIQENTIDYIWSSGKDGLIKTSGTSITITEADVGYPILASARYTDNAGFTEGVGASTEDIKPTFNVSASIVKGPVEGAICEISEVTANGEAILPQQADAPSDASGNVTFTDTHIANNGLLSCTGGTYTDESTGSTLDAPQLRSVVKVIEDGGVSVDGDGKPITDADGNEVRLPAPVYVVSPLTEIVVQNTDSDLNNFDEVAEDINARFGIRFDTTEVGPTVVGTDTLGADGAEESDRYGSVLALISQLDADNTDDDISTVISDLSSDIADGDFADSLDSFATAQLNLETTSAVASSVDSSLLSIIGASVGYNDTEVTAIIEGDLSGVVRNTGEEALTATLTIIDPNFNEDSFIEQSDVVLTYGTFSISANGVWTYTVNTENETVAALEVGASVSDSVTIASADGTTAEITIRVAALTQVVEIKNLGSRTGEIRFDVPDLRQGKLTASILKETAVGSDGNSKDAYIRISGSESSNAKSLIDLRIQGDQTSVDADGTVTQIAPRFLVRNSDNAAYTGGILTADFVENEFHEVDITWDVDATEQITVTFNGEVLFGGSFSTPAVLDSDYVDLSSFFANGIEEIQFRFGDGGTTIPFASYFVDNIEVFSDTAGTTSVFSDDLESRALGDTLEVVSDTEETYGQVVDAEVAVFDVGDGTVAATPAVFFDLTGSINSDETTPLTGTITVQDINDGEATIVESTVTGTYGDFTILADGSWTYTLDTANADIAVLERGNFVLETFTIESADGTTTELEITVIGALVVDTGTSSGLGSPGNQYANVTDVAGSSADATDTINGITALVTANDTGELRINLGSDNTIETGRMTFQMYKGTESNTGIDGFILIGGVDTGSGESILDLRLDQSGNHFDIRNGSTGLSTYNTDTIYDVEISWDASAATTEKAPTIAILIDGVPLFSGDSTTTNLTEAQNGVTFIQFRVADGDDITRADFRIDDLIVYETVDGTESIAFEDNFEDYTTADSLDPNANDAGDFSLQQTPSPLIKSEYDSNSFSVTVDVE